MIQSVCSACSTFGKFPTRASRDITLLRLHSSYIPITALWSVGSRMHIRSRVIPGQIPFSFLKTQVRLMYVFRKDCATGHFEKLQAIVPTSVRKLTSIQLQHFGSASFSDLQSFVS